MEDIRIKITADSDVKAAQNDLSELLKANNELIKSINSLRETMDAKANQAKRSTEEEIGLINKLKASIQTLTDARNKSLNTSEIESYNKKIQQQTTELQKLTSVQQQSTVLTKEQNAQIQSLTGNAEKSNGMFKNLAITLGAMFAADRILDYTKSLFDATIAAERQNIALKNISATNEEYANSIGFLNEITNKYGQNINSVRESYVGFIAASKSSNLALSERQKIYESVIQAGSTLQLSNDKIERSLNAVSQMFSKGNISAEELRQQLGESLPGAFGIMAKALNVNEKQLNKMLEQGEVLAKDALPKFGAALTELYGDKAQSNVNTWAGGLNRATNAIIAWSQRTNESIGLTRKMADAANWLADNLDSVINAILAMSAAIAVNTLKTIANSAVKQVQLIMLGREVLAKQAASVVTLELTAAETAAAAAATRLNTVMASAPWGIAMIAITAVVGALLEYNDAQQRAYELTEDGIKATDETIKQERIHAIELGNTIEATKKLMYGTVERITAVKALMAQYPQYFKDMTAEQVSNWHLTNAYRGVNAEIERKITLMAREKAVEKQTDRLVDIKLELESMGVYVKTLKEFNLEEQKRGLHINLNGPKIHALLKEQDQLSTSLIKTTDRLSESQRQMFNQEAQNNKAKLQSGLISEKEFKAEVMRIQSVYGIKVQNYKLEDKLITSSVDANKKGNEKKENDEEKHLEFIKKLNEDTNEKIKKIDEDYTKWLFNEYEKRAKVIDSSVAKITENNKQRWTENSTANINIEEWKNGRIKQLNDKVDKYQKTSMDLSIEAFKNKQQLFEDIFEQSFDSVTKAVNDFYEHLDKKSKEGETSAERQNAALQKAFIDPFKDNINAAKALISGDYVGAAKGLYGYFEGLWKVTIGFRNTLKEIALNEFNTQFESTMANLSSYSEQIKENFEGLADASVEFNQVQKVGVDALIQAEIDRAGKIRDTYTLALSKEDELYQKKIKSINDEYDASIAAINKKYAYQDAMANQAFGAASLLIQQETNQSLMALVTNNDTKLSLENDYQSKRSFVIGQYADKIKPITEGMSQVEINGINEAIEARDAALSKIEGWLQTELQFILSNEGQKRKEYSETERIINEGLERIEQLQIKKGSDDLSRTIAKNLELEAAENTKNLNIETETKRHNDEVVRLGTEKDAALLSSFNALKDAMKAGYSEILAAANEAYTRGLITAEEYLAKLKEINALRGLVGEGTPTLTNDIREKLRSLGIPGFNEGTEKVGGNKGIDKNLALLSYDEGVMKGDLNTKRLDAGLNMSKTVEYAINYKNMLSDSSYVPLEFKPNIMQKLDERMAMQYLLNMNMQPVIEELQAVKMVIKNMPQTEFKIKDGEISKIVRKGNSVQIFKSSMFD